MFEEGEYIVSNENHEHSTRGRILTEGKSYLVTRKSDGSDYGGIVYVLDNLGRKHGYFNRRFTKGQGVCPECNHSPEYCTCGGK